MQTVMGDRASARVQDFGDPGDFASALVGGEFEYMPLPGPRFAARLRVLQVGDVVPQQATDSSHVTRAAIQPGLRVLIVPLHYVGRVPHANGMALRTHNAILAHGGAEFTIACADSLTWGALSVPAGMLEELAESGAAPPRGASLSVLDAAPELLDELSVALGAGGRLAEDDTALLAAPDCAAGLARSLQELLATALAPGLRTSPPGRATREAMRVLRRAEEFMHCNLDRPIYRDELCAALGVSRRKLHDAFVATVGMTPPAYLKLRRFVRARRALRAGANDQALVKAVALSHGNWNLGYFAKDYNALFDKLLSQTVALARAAGPTAGVSSPDSDSDGGVRLAPRSGMVVS